MNTTYRTIWQTACLLMMLLFSAACSDDFGRDEEPAAGDGGQIKFVMEYPMFSPQSRAVADVAQKEGFAEGDCIHISAVFEVRTASGTETLPAKYDCFKFSGGMWQSTSTEKVDQLTWPWNAVKATFEAYYIPGIKASVRTGEPCNVLLDHLYANSDPLYARIEDVPYGRAVNMQFHHLCSRLIVLNTKSTYASEYWLNTQNGSIKNAYSIVRNADNSLEFSFYSEPASNEGCISSLKGNDGNVVYYLAPGDYYGSKLNYSSNRAYLTLNIEELASLEANKSYTLDLSLALGVLEEPEIDDPWEEEDDPPIKLDETEIEEVIESLEGNLEYVLDDGTPILKHDANGALVLMQNLDFQWNEFSPRNLPNTVVFHGNYHYIENLVRPLFYSMQGQVNNLCIRNVNITNLLGGATLSGALARQSSGNVDNIMLDNVRIHVPAPYSTTQSLFVGALFGQAVGGTVSNILLRNNITIESYTPKSSGEYSHSAVNLGGVIGQATSNITGVKMKANAEGQAPTISVVNDCTGFGVLSTGGIVGLYPALGHYIRDCSIDVTVDVSGSTGLQNCAGGLVGRLTAGNVENCNSSGIVKGGKTMTMLVSESLAIISPGRSHVGGLVGFIGANDAIMVSNCNSFSDVVGTSECAYIHPTLPENDLEAFSVGGGIGSCGNTGCPVVDCRAWGNVSGDSSFARCFIGSFIGTSTNRNIELNGRNTVPAGTGAFCGNSNWTSVLN